MITVLSLPSSNDVIILSAPSGWCNFGARSRENEPWRNNSGTHALWRPTSARRGRGQTRTRGERPRRPGVGKYPLSTRRYYYRHYVYAMKVRHTHTRAILIPSQYFRLNVSPLQPFLSSGQFRGLGARAYKTDIVRPIRITQVRSSPCELYLRLTLKYCRCYISLQSVS